MTSGFTAFIQLHFWAPSLSRTIWPERVWLYQTISFHVLCDYQACMPGCREIRNSECGLREKRRRHTWVLGTDSGMYACSNGTQSGNPVVIKAVMDNGNNGIYDLLLSCRIKLGIGGEDGMEIMSRDDDAPGGYIPPWLSGLSSCSSIVVIKGCRVYVIVWYFVYVVYLMCFSTLVAVMDVTAAEDNVIPMAALSHLGGGGQSEPSEWLQQVSQWSGLSALPMRAHWRTVAFFGKVRNLYKCPVFTR